MSNEKMYSADDVCKALHISTWTLINWYSWEKKRVESGKVKKKYLPEPIKLVNQRGKPKRWTNSMIKQLKEYQKGIVVGRSGIYGEYSNPSYVKKEAKNNE